MTALIFKKTVHLPRPSESDRRAHDQRLQDALGLGPVAIPLSVLRRLPSLVAADAPFPCIIGRIGSGLKLIDAGTERSYSIALDLGTTNFAALLYDNLAQKVILARGLENPQVEFGSDIITRMQCAMSAGGNDVYRAMLRGVNTLFDTLCRDAGIERGEVHAVAAAGNTAMTHFFLGLDIRTIPVDPFVPVVRTPGFFTAAELALDINPEAAVYAFPNAGSYVGGDISAGILASGMFRSDKLSLLIDVGTNAELVIGNKDWLLVAAGAAGPALEEGITRIGKRASTGIIYDVEIKDGRIACKTFDEHAPEGICGSGMVSLLFELFNSGVIDQSGALNPSAKNVAMVEGEPAYAIACGRGDALTIRQSELQNFMKSKAAMFTLLLVLTRSVGISFKDIKRVYVSGALGTGIDARKAAAIGMLPAWPAELVTPLGNSSLEGARMLLADAGLLDAVGELAAKITYKDMHDDPEFMREYLGAVFIPHTNPEVLKAT